MLKLRIYYDILADLKLQMVVDKAQKIHEDRYTTGPIKLSGMSRKTAISGVSRKTLGESLISDVFDVSDKLSQKLR